MLGMYRKSFAWGNIINDYWVHLPTTNLENYQLFF